MCLKPALYFSFHCIKAIGKDIYIFWPFPPPPFWQKIKRRFSGKRNKWHWKKSNKFKYEKKEESILVLFSLALNCQKKSAKKGKNFIKFQRFFRVAIIYTPCVRSVSSVRTSETSPFNLFRLYFVLLKKLGIMAGVSVFGWLNVQSVSKFLAVFQCTYTMERVYRLFYFKQTVCVTSRTRYNGRKLNGLSILGVLSVAGFQKDLYHGRGFRWINLC